jgi:hypothetical protein
MEETRERSSAYNREASSVRDSSFRRHLFRDHIESPGYFVYYHREIQSQHRLFRIDYQVNRPCATQNLSLPPYRFSQAPLDPVALHSATKRTTDGKADARALVPRRRTGNNLAQIKNANVR